MKIFLTKKAEKNYHSLREFITEEWGENVADAFVQKTINFFDLLELFPELGSMEFPEKRSEVFN